MITVRIIADFSISPPPRVDIFCLGDLRNLVLDCIRRRSVLHFQRVLGVELPALQTPPTPVSRFNHGQQARRLDLQLRHLGPGEVRSETASRSDLLS